VTHVIIRVIDGRHCCGLTRFGVDWSPEGCSHETPREALDHSDRVQRRLDWESTDLVSPTPATASGDGS